MFPGEGGASPANKNASLQPACFVLLRRGDIELPLWSRSFDEATQDENGPQLDGQLWPLQGHEPVSEGREIERGKERG